MTKQSKPKDRKKNCPTRKVHSRFWSKGAILVVKCENCTGKCDITNETNKRKNLEFQMLAAVYHKGDHGQYCYTLK